MEDLSTCLMVSGLIQKHWIHHNLQRGISPGFLKQSCQFGESRQDLEWGVKATQGSTGELVCLHAFFHEWTGCPGITEAAAKVSPLCSETCCMRWERGGCRVCVCRQAEQRKRAVSKWHHEPLPEEQVWSIRYRGPTDATHMPASALWAPLMLKSCPFCTVCMWRAVFVMCRFNRKAKRQNAQDHSLSPRHSPASSEQRKSGNDAL